MHSSVVSSLGTGLWWMSPRGACQTSAFQALPLWLSSAGLCGLLSWQACWWSCSGSQAGAQAHCREAGGRHSGRAGSKQAIWRFLSWERLWTERRSRLRRKCQWRDVQLQVKWHPTCQVQNIIHVLTQTADCSRRKTLHFVTCFSQYDSFSWVRSSVVLGERFPVCTVSYSQYFKELVT